MAAKEFCFIIKNLLRRLFLYEKKQFLVFSLTLALVATVFSAAYVTAGPLKGVLNSDGDVNSIDFALMRSHLLGIPTSLDTSNADLNGDGETNSIDFALLRSYLLGIITSFPAENSAPNPTTTPSGEKDDMDLIGDIIFSVLRGTIKNQISVTLSSQISNSQIRYTTDGSIPNNNSKLYSDPLTFTKTTQLRAQSFVDGSPSGDMGKRHCLIPS